MRRSLAPHAHVPTVPLDTPEVSALRQRAERAERNAAGWQRLAMFLATACAVLAALLA